jgi:hypothetical protein
MKRILIAFPIAITIIMVFTMFSGATAAGSGASASQYL